MLNLLRKAFVPPVFIFQMGKVGSSSLWETLSDDCEGVVVQAHSEQMLTEAQKRLIKWRIGLRLSIYVVCPVREPLSRNISAFFENFKRDTEYEITDHQWTTDEILNLFLKQYPHNNCLDWFDNHMKTVFGVDVFSEPFPAKQKWKVYKGASVQVLVYRTDLDHSEQLAVVSRFIGRDIPEWIYRNTSKSKDYADVYKQFCDSARLPDLYISRMCKSQFCRHFWTPEEIEAIGRRWRGEESREL